MNLTLAASQGNSSLTGELIASGLSVTEAAHLTELRSDPNTKAALVLQAFGVPASMIEESLGLNDNQIQAALHVPELADFYADWSIKIKSQDSDTALERMVPVALFVQESIMNDKNTPAALRAKVAAEILDRVKGRAKQSVEIRSTNINLSAKEVELNRDLDSVMKSIEKMEAERDVIRNAKPITAVDLV